MDPARTACRGVLVLFTAFAMVAGLAAGAVAQRRPVKDRGEWKAPARAARKANPVAADAASIKAGKALYAAECLDCHGGRGDMPGFDDMLSEEERWHVLNYARATFAPADKADDAATVASQKRPGANK